MDTETVADGVMSAADGDPIETFPRETNETPEVRHETPPGRGPRRLPRERELPQTFVERETPRAPLEREPHPEPVERESRTMWDRDAAPVPRSPSFRATEPVRAPELADEVDADVETAGAGLDAGSGGGDAGSEGFTARRRRRAVPGKRR